jgi:hypothetical protein
MPVKRLLSITVKFYDLNSMETSHIIVIRKCFVYSILMKCDINEVKSIAYRFCCLFYYLLLLYFSLSFLLCIYISILQKPGKKRTGTDDNQFSF